MSTSLADIDDASMVDDTNDYDVQDQQDSQQSSFSISPKSVIRGLNYRGIAMVFLASLIALKLPIDLLRNNVPSQVFYMGSAPVRALLVVLMYMLVEYVGFNLFP